MSDFVGKCDFEPEFHNSSSVWRIVLAVAARKIYLLGNLFVMAQGNNPSVPKMQLDDLDFADDLALLPHNQRQIQDKTIFLGTMSAGTGLKISKKKTELMKINTTANKPVTVGGDPIMEVDSVIYLGSAVDRRGHGQRCYSKDWQGQSCFCHAQEHMVIQGNQDKNQTSHLQLQCEVSLALRMRNLEDDKDNATENPDILQHLSAAHLQHQLARDDPK